MNPIEKIIPHLDNVKQRGNSYRANCPCRTHRQDPSLSVTELPDGKVIIKCWSGCDTGDVLDAMGLTFSDLFTDDGKPYKRDYSSNIEDEKLVLGMIKADVDNGKPLTGSMRERAELAIHRIKALEGMA